MSQFLQVFCSIFSGFIAGYAIPNEFSLFGSPLAGFTALIPLYIAVSQAKSYRQAFYLTGLQALVVHILSSFWLANFRDFAIFTLGASALATAVIAAVFGHFLYVPFAQRGREQRLAEYGGGMNRALPFRILWFAALFTVWEWFKSIGFLGYPWGTISMSVISCPVLMQIADITGTYGITFLAAFFAAVCGEGLLLIPVRCHLQNAAAVRTAYTNTAAACAALLLLSLLYGVVEYVRPRTPLKFLNTVMVQQNSDPWNSESDSENIRLSMKLSEDKIQELRSEGREPDIVVWSEGVLCYAFPGAGQHYKNSPQPESLSAFIQRMQVPFIIGGSYTINRKKQQYSNAALLFSKNGEYCGQYGKMHLVPFAEVIPGADLAWVKVVMNAVVGFSSGWTPGRFYTLFRLPAQKNPAAGISPDRIVPADPPEAPGETTVLAGVPICFEDAFPDICGQLFRAGSELFINITDDSWSLTKSAEYQHYAVAAFRAIEYRTTLVRSTNAGYSVVLTPAGKKTAGMRLFTAAAAAVPVPVYRRQTTIYAQFGNWLPEFFAAAAGIYLVSMRYKEHKKNRSV
ncbi:MAG: apolipoprotein N-acyltransferase [Treponema sp.]|jgi:apolipoprotein N-acyltransferase|nr:apolipoprotein N-acyltransferase [Treponema sp.]